jgi:hypothetical protein
VRPPRFRTRTLMVAVAAVGVALGAGVTLFRQLSSSAHLLNAARPPSSKTSVKPFLTDLGRERLVRVALPMDLRPGDSCATAHRRPIPARASPESDSIAPNAPASSATPTRNAFTENRTGLYLGASPLDSNPDNSVYGHR